MWVPILIACIFLYFLKNKNGKFLYVGFFLLLFLNIFRDSTVGTDYKYYIQSFENISTLTISSLRNLSGDVFSLTPSENREIGWIFLNSIVKYYNGTYFIVNLVAAVIILFLYFIAIKRESPSLSLSLYLLLMLYIYYQSFNTTRQSVSVALFIFSIYYIKEKKFLLYSILCIFASLMHTSAIFLIPLYFLKYINLPYKSVTIIIIITFLIPLFSIDDFFVNLFTGDIIYLNYVKNIRQFSFYGYMPVVTILTVQSMFFLYSLKLEKKPDISMKIWFIGLLFQNITMRYDWLSRFSDYFLVMQIIAIPIVYSNTFNDKNKQTYFNVAILYSIFIYAFNIYANTQGILPYYFNF